MTLEIIVVLLILVAAVILFASERLPVDLVALMIMAALLLTRIISPEEGIAGFSNTATITVGAMFILSAALSKTGAVNFVGRALVKAGRRSFWLAVIITMLMVGSLSAFINNTAAVAIFMPIVLGLSRDIKVSPSKLLMPLSYASMFGGVCTLIGTSTNILVSSIAERHGQPAFGMFEFAGLGILMFGAGLIYMIAIGIRLIPERRPAADLTQTFGLGDYLTDVVLLPSAKSAGKPLSEAPLGTDLDIIEVRRDGKPLPLPSAQTVLQAGDVIRVRCNVEAIKKLEERMGVTLKPGMKWRDQDLESSEAVLVEAVIAPSSSLAGLSLKKAGFRNMFGATALAIRHHGQLMRERLGTMTLQPGDALLIEVRRDRLEDLKRNPAFVIVSEPGLPEFRRDKIPYAILIVAAVVTTAALGLFPIVVSAVIGCVLLVLTGCITLEEAYRSIEWRVIFLLAGVLTLGVALEKSGAAHSISSTLTATVGFLGPVAIISAFYLGTLVLTETMSNNATAALLAPVAIAAAESLGMNPRPFLMAVTFAASASFMTPVGYQTNTLIYGPGQYRFADFLRVGTPLNLLFWLLATLVIPVLWPL
jgi:di/tricarboxylate transporter